MPLHVNEDKAKSVISAATGDDDALLPISATDASNLYPDSEYNVPDGKYAHCFVLCLVLCLSGGELNSFAECSSLQLIYTWLCEA